MLFSHLQQVPAAASHGCWGCHSAAQGSVPQRLQECSTTASWDCTPGAPGVWRHRRRGCCTPRSSPDVQAGNGQGRHPDQIPRHGHGQTDLFASSGHKMHPISPSTHRAGTAWCRSGLCPLPNGCSRHIAVNRALKSRGQLLCIQGCREGWTRGSGPSHAFNTKQLQICIII